MKSVSFNPREVTDRIFADLPQRSRDILMHRYGLTGEGKKTLEHIGNQYDITRERVRQIENLAKDQIRKSEVFIESAKGAIDELHQIIDMFGGVAEERDLLDTVSADELDRNHIYLLLDLAHPFYDEREDAQFNRTWATNTNNRVVVKKSLQKLYKDMDRDEIISEREVVQRFMDRIEHDLVEGNVNDDVARRWIRISKKIGKNPLDGWGRADSPSIKTRGVRDYMYLILREYQKPMHFSELAAKASEHFGKKINIATAHNELIKDDRFILVGRGLYYLKDSDFYAGTVSQLITEILKKEKSLPEDEIVKRVLERKLVKESTILINLKNKKLFSYDKAKGLYSLAKKK